MRAPLEITETQIHLCKIEPGFAPLAAFARIVINDALVINGIRIILGRFGPFVSYPRELSTRKEGRAYHLVHPIRQETGDMISRTVLAAYREKVAEAGAREASAAG